jgi:hypothetical protein
MSRIAQKILRRSAPRTSKSAWQPFFPAKPATTSQTEFLEAEADRAAAQVTTSDVPSFHKTFFVPASIQMKSKECEENEMISGLNEMAGSAPGNGKVASFFSQSPTGIPLPEPSKKFFGIRFGHDFSSVRIHHDHRASVSAESIGALAYTVGNHIVFNKNQFSPETSEGKKLLAHELTHVIQQTGTIRRKPDDRCRKDLPDIEDPELLGKAFKKMKASIPAAHQSKKGKIKARKDEDGAYYMFNIHNNAGCDAVRQLLEGTEFFLIKEGLFYHQVWVRQPDTPADKFYWGWVDKDFLEFIEEKKKDRNDGKNENEDEGEKTQDDEKPKAIDNEGKNNDSEPKKSEGEEEGLNECDDATFCTPYADRSLAETVKKLCRQNLEDYVFVFLISEAEDLWREYFNRKPGDDMTPKKFKSPDSPLAEKFGDDSLTLEHQEKILENIVAKSHDQAIDVYADRPIFYRVELLADASLLNTPLEFDDVLFSPNTALTAGGAGGNDRRAVSGTIAIEPSVKNDVTGEQNWRVFTKLTLWVKDTIDFCPGKCGSTIEKLTLTLPLSRLEATGLVYDVPFEIFADITPVHYDYLESDLKVRVRESP